MEEEISIAPKIDEVRTIVALEKSELEEPLVENEQSNYREENKSNNTSIEVAAANNPTTDRSELAILPKGIVNQNVPPISISETKRVPCALGECEEFCSVTDGICQQCPESERCYQYCSLHISHGSHSNQTSSKRRGKAAAVTGEGQQRAILPIREELIAATIVPEAVSEVSTVVQSSAEDTSIIIDLSNDKSPSSDNLVSEIHDGKSCFPLRDYEELQPRLDNNPWEGKDQLKSTHSILYAKVDKYKLGERPFYRAFSDNGSQVKLNFGDIITDSSKVSGIPHIFVGARLFEERNTVLLFFIKYWELFNACKSSPNYPSSTTVDSAIVNNLWMLDFYGKNGEFLSKFCKGDELYVTVRTIKCPRLQMAIIQQVDAVLKNDITKLYVGELESAFLVVNKSHNPGCDDDAVDVGDDDNNDELQIPNSNSSQLTRVPSSRIKNIVTSRLLTEKLKTSSDGCKGNVLEPTSKKNSDSLATSSLSSSGKKKKISSGSESISSAKDLATYTNTEINRMNKPALSQIALSLGHYSGRDLEIMSKKEIVEYLQLQRSLPDKSAASKRISSTSSSAQDLSGKYPRHSEYSKSPIHRTTSFGRKDEARSSPVRRTTSLVGRKDEQITRQQQHEESSVINLTTNSSSTIIPVTAPSSNENSQNERLVNQLISLTTALTSANATIIQTTNKVGEETKQRLVEAEELIKKREIEHHETYSRMLVAETKCTMLNEFSTKEKTNREEEREYLSKVQNQCQNTPQLTLLEKVVMKDEKKAPQTPANTFPEASISTVSSPLIVTPTIQQPIITNQQPPPQQQMTYRETFSPALQQNQNREDSVDFHAKFLTSQLQPHFTTHQSRQYTKQQDLHYQVQEEQNSCLPEQQFAQYQPPSQKQYQQQSNRQHSQHSQQQSQQDEQQYHQQLSQQYQQSQRQSCSSQQYQPPKYQQPQYQSQSQQQYHQQQCQQPQQYQQDASEYYHQHPQKNQHQIQLNNQSFGRAQYQMQILSDEKSPCYCNVPRIRDGGKFCGSCGGVVPIKLACCGIVSSGSFCTNCGTAKGFN